MLDERGFPRPVSGASSVSIGAYEPQYAAGASPNQIFVENLYEVLLNRPAEPGGLAAATNALNAGVSPTNLVRAIEGSPEFLGREADYVGHRYLDRSFTAADRANVVSYLGSHTPEQLAAFVVGTPEFYNDYGDNNAVFFEGVYADVLDRAAIATEVDFWDDIVANGTSRAGTAALFLGSTEYLTDLAESYFVSYLGRGPQPPDVAAYIAAAQAGVSSLTLGSIALGSPESFAKRT